jgi:hypothetical protein
VDEVENGIRIAGQALEGTDRCRQDKIEAETETTEGVEMTEAFETTGAQSIEAMAAAMTKETGTKGSELDLVAVAHLWIHETTCMVMGWGFPRHSSIAETHQRMFKSMTFSSNSTEDRP